MALSTKVTPLGNPPASPSVGFGKPLLLTVNVPALPAMKVAFAALVIAGAWSTSSVKFCVAFVPTPFDAVIVIEYEPPVPAAGVPLSRPVELKLTPLGSVLVVLKVGAGVPVAVTWKLPAVPTVNVVVFALVIVGASLTCKVKLCEASVPMPLCAVIVIG